MKFTLRSAFLLGLLCSVAATTRADSLWTNSPQGERSLVADRKAANTGDILTIVVQENAKNKACEGPK